MSERDPSDNYTGPEPARIREMFRSISGQYDRANTILSAGIHHLWRRRTVRYSEARPGDRVLDCATGTGDLAIAFARVVGDRGEVIGTDFVEEMLQYARRKAPHLRFDPAEVTRLPYPDSSFDVTSIAFGIRNVSDPDSALAEMSRVTKPGGRVMVLEFGQPPNRLVSFLYDRYRKGLLPRIGGMITGRPDAYQYLESSSARFPSADAFAQRMRNAGPFAAVDWKALTFGIAYLYRGIKK